jgi:hypothetical protein
LNTLLYFLYSVLGTFCARLGYLIEIGDCASLSRLIHAPRMGDSIAELKQEVVFNISVDKPESINLDRLCPHSFRNFLGLRIEINSATDKPRRYLGYLQSTASAIRSFETKAGFGYKIEHSPSEGLHHVHISFRSKGSTQPSRSERNELRVALVQKVFLKARAYGR